MNEANWKASHIYSRYRPFRFGPRRFDCVSIVKLLWFFCGSVVIGTAQCHIYNISTTLVLALLFGNHRTNKLWLGRLLSGYGLNSSRVFRPRSYTDLWYKCKFPYQAAFLVVMIAPICRQHHTSHSCAPRT